MIKSQLIVIYLKWKLIVIHEEIEIKRGQAQKPSITYLCVLTLVFKCFKILVLQNQKYPRVFQQIFLTNLLSLWQSLF